MEHAAEDGSASLPAGEGDRVVAPGECLFSIAAGSGHAWSTLWEHPRNQALRSARRHPGVLLPGDRVFVPPVAAKSVLLESGKRHRIVIDGALVPLRLRMCDADGEPRAGAGYRLEVAGLIESLTSDEDGRIEAQVPVAAEAADLVDLATGERLRLRIGHLDPVASPAAIRKRLANLGYGPDAEADVVAGPAEATEALLDDFRDDAGLAAQTPVDEVARRLEEVDPWNS